jgi:hypothetical protein
VSVSIKVCVFGLAALSCLGGASVAQAATLTGAEEIVVTSAVNNWLQVAQVIAIQAGTGKDVALASNGAVAYAPNQWNATSVPANAIDGVYPSSFPNIYHSGVSIGAFLDVTLAHPADLSSLTIYGRVDCCATRDDYNVSIRNAAGTTIWSGELDGSQAGGGPTTVTFSTGVPEVSTWVMMLAGFAGLGLAGYRFPGISADTRKNPGRKRAS